MPSPRSPPAPRLSPPPAATRPAQGPKVEGVTPTVAAPEVIPVETEHDAISRTQAAAETAPAQGSPAVVTTRRMAKAEEIPGAAAAAVVRRAQIAAAPAAIDQVVDGAGEGGIAKVAAAEISAVVVTPAAVAIPQIGPAVVAVAQPATAEVDGAKVAAAGVSLAAVDPDNGAAEIPLSENPSVEAPLAEVRAAELTVPPTSTGDDRPLAVTGSVDPTEAGGDGIVFRIELSRPAEQTVVLIYGTVDGTALAGKDYEPQQGVVTLAPGSKGADVRVPLIEHRRPRDARFGLFLTADPKVAKVVDSWISATIPAAD